MVQPVSARGDVHSVLRCGSRFHFAADCNCNDTYCITELRLFFSSLQVAQIADFVAAQLAYQQRNGESESGKFVVLGIEPSK